MPLNSPPVIMGRKDVIILVVVAHEFTQYCISQPMAGGIRQSFGRKVG
jgi:hypothetical protein